MSLLRRLTSAFGTPPARRPGPPPLTGFQIGLVRAASKGRLWLDTWQLTALLTNARGQATDVSPDVPALMRARLLRHDPFELTEPPETRQPRFVYFHPTRKGDDLLMAAAQRKKKGGRRA